MRLHWVAFAVLLTFGAAASAQQATDTVRTLNPRAAQRALQAAMDACAKAGYQVAVAAVDRSGVALAMLRDRYAGPHTPDTATAKAWTAVSFKISTTELGRATQPGQPMSAIRQLPRVTAVGGGLPIEAAGSLVGGIGVSGAPGGDADEACARAGIAAIADDLEL